MEFKQRRKKSKRWKEPWSHEQLFSFALRSCKNAFYNIMGQWNIDDASTVVLIIIVTQGF